MLVGEVFARMGLDSKQYEKDLGRLEGVTQKQATTLGGIFKGAFSVALGIGVFEAVKRGFQTIASTAISFNAQMEQARIGFTTMLGSAERAEAFLSDMADFAAKTPFEFPELLDASKRMLAYGFAAEDVLPTMEAVGNASAAVGLGTEGINRIILALGQMRAKGKLSAEEMRQLTETGIPAWEILAEAMNKTTAEIMDMQQKGLIPADRAIKMLVEGMNKRFPNMMAQMEDTWEGVTSTIKDVWQMTIGALTSDLFKGITTWLRGVRDMATEFYEAFQAGGLSYALEQTFGPDVAAAANAVTGALRTFWAVVTGIANTIRTAWPVLKPIIYGVVIGFLSFKTVTFVINTARKATEFFTLATLAMKGSLKEGPALFQLISRAVGTYRLQLHLASMAGIATTGVMARLRIALYSLWTALGPIGWITIALSLLVSAGIWVYQNWEKVKHYGLQAWGALKVGIGYYVMGIIKLYKFLLGWIPGLGKVFDNLLSKVSSFVSREKSIMASRKSTYADANKPVNEMTKKQQELLNAAQDSMGAINDQGDAIKDAGKKTKKAGKEAKGGLADFDEIHQVMQQTADAADDAAGGVGGLGDLGDIGGLGDLGDLGDLGNLGNLGGIGDFGQVEEQTSILGGIWDGVKEKWNNFKEWVKGWDIWTWIGEKWNNFKIWAGDFWSSVQTKWNNFRNWAAEKWNTFFDPIREKWNNFKIWAGDFWSSVQTKWNNFRNWAAEKWNTFFDPIREKWNNFKIWAGDFWSNIQTKWNNFKTWVAERWNTFFNPIKEKWNNFKTWVNGFWETPKTKWNQAINWMKEKVKSIRDAFNFNWSLPRIKLPHFYVNWSFGGYLGKAAEFLGLPGIPRFSVSWYKEGGIFSQPSVIGVGEAGREAVLPLDSNTGWADIVADRLASAMQGSGGTGSGDIYVYIGNEQVDAYIHRSQDRRNIRSNGR